MPKKTDAKRGDNNNSLPVNLLMEAPMQALREREIERKMSDLLAVQQSMAPVDRAGEKLVPLLPTLQRIRMGK